MEDALTLFHPLIQKWFMERFGQPTTIQARSWPEITLGKHLLITAPTGSGKTLTAFLWALDRLITGVWHPGQTRVLYVSPLKALNNDIQRNLLEPLDELRMVFERAGEPFPPIHVLTRSGDTPSDERQRMIRRPPEILITTPESLNLLISSTKARRILTSIVTVILDEIHAVADSKRGTHLMTAVERLTLLAGEFQRIALSATVKPLESVAEWIGGYRLERQGESVRYIKRPVTSIESEQDKRYHIRIQYPEGAIQPRTGENYWLAIAQELKPLIKRNRSTLIFTNNRRLTEQISLLLNQEEEEPIAYAHHGSLSRETRTAIEERLKKGELSTIVATGSLELGIDIGALDEVILLQTPFTISTALQRIGRAGHGVGQISRGTFFPTNARDLLDAVVMSRVILERDIERTHTISCPLDILAQIVTAMTGVEPWNIDNLYQFLRCCAAYHHLKQQDFELVLKAISGAYAGSRLRALRPLISMDRIDRTLRARPGTLQSVYQSGGTIPDRGYFTLRHCESRAPIGDLDEEFVWESRPGDTFTLGSQTWTIQSITHSDVLVSSARGPANETPFWKAEEVGRDFHFAEKIGEFLEWASGHSLRSTFINEVRKHYGVDTQTAAALCEHLHQQKRATRTDPPHRHHLLIEYTSDSGISYQGQQAIFHTLWGGAVNRPLALALSAVWEERHGTHIEFRAHNDGIVGILPHHTDAKALLLSITSNQLEHHVHHQLERSGFFAARFRENAARALLLPKDSFHRRTPLWVNRLRAQKLLDAVAQYDDFPILLETWRTCLQDEFDLPTLKQLLDEIHTGATAVSETYTTIPSPFANSMTWQQTNELMYAKDVSPIGRTSKLDETLLQSVLRSDTHRPELPSALIREFTQKAQRTFADYAPRTETELLDWVKERLLVPECEWTELLPAMEGDRHLNGSEIAAFLDPKLVRIRLPNADTTVVAALEIVPQLMNSLGLSEGSFPVESLVDGRTVALPDLSPDTTGDERNTLADWMGQWLQFYGPVTRAFIQHVTGLATNRLDETIEYLIESEDIISGCFFAGGNADDVCNSENLEILLRLARRGRMPALEPLCAEYLPLYIARHQGLTHVGDSPLDLENILEKLLAFPAAAEQWEQEILPARLRSYQTAWLDALMQETNLLWVGCGEKRITFCLREQLELFQTVPHREHPDPESGNVAQSIPPVPLEIIFPDPGGKYDFARLAERSAIPSAQLAETLWHYVWQGQAVNDSMACLRKGIETQFQADDVSTARTWGPRSGYRRWKSTRPFAGNWSMCPIDSDDMDALDRLELQKEQVRILLDRYGILFRDILRREPPSFQWGMLFRAMRIMELSGELIGGYFFQGIAGMQFISPAGLRALQSEWPEDTIYWLHAMDPASLCGIPLEGLTYSLPERRTSNHLVYHGTRLVLVSRRNGKELEIDIPHDSPHLPEVLTMFKQWLERPFQPVRTITIESINQEPAPTSPYLERLRDLFDVSVDDRKVTLRKRYW